MSFAHYIFGVLSLVSVSIHRVGSQLEKYYSVTSFPELEGYYLQMREQDSPTTSELSAEEKWTICKRLRAFFESSSLDEILFNPKEDLEYLQTNYGSIHDDVVAKTTKTLAFFQWQSYDINRSKSRPIYVKLKNRHYDESTFSCFTKVLSNPHDLVLAPNNKNIKILDVKQYYVSERDYNVNEVPKGANIEGRFVFSKDGEKIVLRGLAEETAVRMKVLPINLKSLYLDRRGDESPAAEAKDDPICKLDRSMKMRLCSSVLMELFHNLDPHFTVTGDERCDRNKFYFWAESEAIYDEWMMLCKTNILSVDYEYYVSRSYWHNEIFVYYRFATSGKIYLQNYMSNVGVVNDNRIRSSDNDLKT